MQLSEEQLRSLKKFQKDPNLFFRKVLGCEPESYQERINQTIADNERTAISACHDVGKSWDLARIVLWYGACFPYAKIITTAPTYNQVKNILWAEMRSAFTKAKYPLGGKMNLTEWQITPDGDWFAIGFTPRNEVSGGESQGTQSSFQGFHAPHVLIVFDEATGIPAGIWTMAEGMLTSGSVKFVCIGNPTSRAAEFYKCFSSPDWAKVYLNCFDSPNLKANGINNLEDLKKEIDIVRGLSDSEAQARLKSYKVVKEYLISLKWVVSMGLPRKWGITHPLFVSKVLGEFPKDSDDTLIPLSSVEESFLRVYFPLASDRRTLGVDVARFGRDSTILTALHGKKHLATKPMIKHDATEIVGEVIAFNKEHGPFEVIVVDETGMGGPIVDMLEEAKRENHLPRNTDIRGVQFGASCESEEDRDKFVNIKARMFKLLSDDLKDSNGLALLNEDVYLDELPTIRFRYDSKGRYYIESKDEYKKRTGRSSPDHSDSLALANFGRYDETGVGSFNDEYNGGFARPFAASLGDQKKW